MSNEVLISAENVGKKFCRSLKRSLWYGVQDIATDLNPISGNKDQGTSPKLRTAEFWALRDISFELKRGECLGLIGHNGAGKSTLLKILNGLIKPSTGRIIMHGRVCALLELGTGFNPVLTGRENIYTQGSLLGFSRNEMDEKIDTIIEFSEVGDFIDMPVQNYSSGMRVRLGFSVAAQMEPDILLVDEILAVGDLGFTIKCLNRIAELLRKCAVIFVSHSMPQVAKVSTQCMLLDGGRESSHSTDTQSVITNYFELFNTETSQLQGTGQANCLEFKVGNYSKRQSSVYTFRKPNSIRVRLKISIAKTIRSVCIGLTVVTQEQRLAAITNNLEAGLDLENEKETHLVTVDIPNIFSSGKYSITLGIHELLGHENPVLGTLLLRQGNLFTFIIEGSRMANYTPVQIPAEWTMI